MSDEAKSVKNSKSSVQSPQFEESLQKLELLVKNLESGSLSLEDSLTSFQEGVGLVKQCQTLLSQAEQKVELLIKASGEVTETRPFNVE